MELNMVAQSWSQLGDGATVIRPLSCDQTFEVAFSFTRSLDHYIAIFFGSIPLNNTQYTMSNETVGPLTIFE